MGLSKIIQGIKDAFQPEKPFDASCFNHPTALKVSWSPKKGGGSNFKTRVLKQESSTKLVYKGSKGIIIFGSIFILLPLFFIIPIFTKLDEIVLSSFNDLFIIVPFIFPTVGVLLIYFGSKPIVIDKKLGYLYKSYKTPAIGINVTPNKKWISLNEVIALQILSERIKSKNSSYYSYEINFVFKDATRHNVVDHGKLSAIENDALIISIFLGVPIWNKMTGKTTLPEDTAYNDGISHYDSKGQYDDSYKQYDSDSRYVDPSENDRYSSSSQDNNDLDEPYDSLKKRKL